MIILYVLEHCPYCNEALDLLKKNKIKHKKIIVENDEIIKNKYKKLHKMNSFPQIFIKKSDKTNNKIMAIIDNKQTIHFGDSRYSDYTKHKDPERKTNIFI